MGPPVENQPSENIYSEWEKQKHQHDERPPPIYIMLPHNQFRLAWDVFMACLLCVMAFYIPYRVCFFWNDEEDEDNTSVFIFEMIVDALFAVGKNDVFIKYIGSIVYKMNVKTPSESKFY